MDDVVDRMLPGSSVHTTGDRDQPVERLYSELRAKILTGELKPGSVLSQVKLARAFDVSRNPLREALRMLQREGLVQAEFNRRIRISPLSTAELEQIYAHRVAVEAIAIRTSIVHFDSADIARLHELIAEMETFLPHPGERVIEWERPHQEFHQLLVSYAGDAIVEDLRRLRDHSERYRTILGKELLASFGRGTYEHRIIVEACEAGDKALAGRLLAEHLARSGLALIAETDPAHDSAVLRQALLIFQSSASHQD